MGLRSSKPKRSKDNTIKNSVTNKHVQQTNKLREQTSDIRHLANKPGKQNNDFQIKKNKKESKKCQINASAEVTDESDTDNEDSTKIKTEETKASIQDLYKLPKTKQNNDKGFQTKKNKNKNKICQMKESAQVTEESDTDKEDSTKIKTDKTEATIFPKIPIMDSRPSRSKKTRDDFDIDKWDFDDFDIDKWDDEDYDTDKWDDEESHQTSSLSDKWWCDKEWLKTKKSSSSNINFFHKMHEIKCLEFKIHLLRKEAFLDYAIEETGRRSSFNTRGIKLRTRPTGYKCHSSDNNETQITRMDKIKAEGNIPYVPRRNRPATPPRDVLD